MAFRVGSAAASKPPMIRRASPMMTMLIFSALGVGVEAAGEVDQVELAPECIADTKAKETEVSKHSTEIHGASEAFSSASPASVTSFADHQQARVNIYDKWGPYVKFEGWCCKCDMPGGWGYKYNAMEDDRRCPDCEDQQHRRYRVFAVRLKNSNMPDMREIPSTEYKNYDAAGVNACKQMFEKRAERGVDDSPFPIAKLVQDPDYGRTCCFCGGTEALYMVAPERKQGVNCRQTCKNAPRIPELPWRPRTYEGEMVLNLPIAYTNENLDVRKKCAQWYGACHRNSDARCKDAHLVEVSA